MSASTALGRGWAGLARKPGRARVLRALAVACGYAVLDRALLLLVTVATLPLPPAGQLRRGVFSLWAEWGNWDGRWYSAIATSGYRPDLRRFAFFPLLPMLEAWLRGFVGGNADAAGVVVSLVCSCAAFAMLYERVSAWSDEATAERTVRYLALFPTGFFLAAAYTESLFLALVLACMWGIQRRRWLAAGVVGALAALARNAGVLLALPAGWALLQARPPLRRWWPLALIPAALLGFMGYQAAVAHDPLAFIHVEAAWNRHVTWPWVTAGLLWWALGHAPDPAGNVANLASAVLSAGTLLLGRRWIPTGDQIIAWAIWALSVAAPAQPPALVLLSMDRFVLVMYPLYAVLARLGGQAPRLDRALMLVMPVAQAALFTLFIHHYFVG
jgi:hypothetical protein